MGDSEPQTSLIWWLLHLVRLLDHVRPPREPRRSVRMGFCVRVCVRVCGDGCTRVYILLHFFLIRHTAMLTRKSRNVMNS